MFPPDDALFGQTGHRGEYPKSIREHPRLREAPVPEPEAMLHCARKNPAGAGLVNSSRATSSGQTAPQCVGRIQHALASLLADGLGEPAQLIDDFADEAGVVFVHRTVLSEISQEFDCFV